MNKNSADILLSDIPHSLTRCGTVILLVAVFSVAMIFTTLLIKGQTNIKIRFSPEISKHYGISYVDSTLFNAIHTGDKVNIDVKGEQREGRIEKKCTGRRNGEYKVLIVLQNHDAIVEPMMCNGIVVIK